MPEPKRITPDMPAEKILDMLRRSPGYFLTNNERDVSQSDFKGRIMPQTTLKVAPFRDDTGYFAFEISGGASIHVDLLRKQINPFEKLRLIRKAMPRTLLQTVCRGRNLFGYRPYPDNVIRMTVRLFSRYIDVWRIYDFLNHVPNLKVVAEEVKRAGKILMPCICFNTAPEYTDSYYIEKVEEMLSTMGEDIILGIKNHSALGTPKRIGELVRAIRQRFPYLLISYHGHNTDGNDLGRMVAAVLEGARIVEVSDHGFGGMFGQAPALSFIQTLNDYGLKATGLKLQPLINTSDILRRERRLYERFESPYRGFDPTVKKHKLSGGATTMALDQADDLNLMDRIHEVFDELIQVNADMGNICSATPGTQIFWTTAVNNVLHGRYEKPTDDLKRLLLGRYGPFPFYDPPEWIYEKVLEHNRTDGKKWMQILSEEAGVQRIEDADTVECKRRLEGKLQRSVTDEELCLYVQFPHDALEYLRFEDRFGKTYLLPPEVWFKRGGFSDGTRITVPDDTGKTHHIDVISTWRTDDMVHTSLLVDYHFQTNATKVRSGKH